MSVLIDDDALEQHFFDTLAALSIIAEGPTARPDAVGGRVQPHSGAPKPLEDVPLVDTVKRLRVEWLLASPGRRRQLEAEADDLLRGSRTAPPRRERYDRSEAMRRRIARMPGSSREVADQFLDLSHTTVADLRKRYAVPEGTLEERVRLARDPHVDDDVDSVRNLL